MKLRLAAQACCRFCAMCGIFLVGCSGPVDVDRQATNVAADDGHNHAHSHAQTGPHGGHLVELGNEAYHAEWLHEDDSGLVTVYILDSAIEQEVPIAASQISIGVKIGDTDSQHLLAAVNPSKDGQTAQFELSNKSLIEALKLAGQGAEATVRLEIDGKPYAGQFEYEDHSGHNH